MIERFENQECVIFDVETTGLSAANGDRIIEIAALKIRGGEVLDRFHSLVDPQREVSWSAFLVNGISPEMLQGAPRSQEVLPGFLSFLGDGWLIGHNVKFDVGFLSRELARINSKLNKDTVILDTLRMSRRLLPELSSHRLWMVARFLGITSIQQHRAMADVEMTYAVFMKLMELARSHDFDGFDHFVCR